MATFAQKLKNVGRFTTILNVLVRYGFRNELQKTELAHLLNETGEAEHHQESQNTSKYTVAKRLVAAFEELGPTFVKFGQLLAAREDVFPKAFVSEFKKLQDNAKPISFETIQKTLQAELSQEVFQNFEHIDEIPLGSASIGQVHKARLRGGKEVVLKIQRPEIETVVRTDISLLFGLAQFLENIVPEMKTLRPTVVLDELQRALFAELDYFKEAANTEKVRQNFLNEPTIHIPEVFREYSSKHVLCMEYMKGVKLTDLKPGTEQIPVVQKGVFAFLDMAFQHGLFHADLHPGNFLLLGKGENLVLAIIDFGLTARLSRHMREILMCLFMSLVQEDLETFSRLFLELLEQEDESPTAGLELKMRDIVDAALARPLNQIQVGRLLMQIAQLCASHHAPVSRDLVLFFRALIALESFGKTLAPQFNVLFEAKKYGEQFSGSQFSKNFSRFLAQDSFLLMRDSQALLKELPSTLRALSKRIHSGQINLKVKSEEILFLAKEVDRASNRLSLALMLGALVLASSLLTYDKEGRYFENLPLMGLIGFGVAGFLGIWLILGILRSGRFK
jgi:ubiquinone biosynthesis protein